MHPGLTVFYAGLIHVYDLMWGLILLPIVIWLITSWVIVPEENYLEQKPGTEYLDYISRVTRWV